MTHDEPLAALAGLDPVRLHDPAADRPPARGSTRYDSILERAMHATGTGGPTATTTRPTGPTDPTTGPTDPMTERRHGRRARPLRPRRAPRAAILALTTGAAAAAAAGAILLQPGGGTSPVAALTRAAATTAEVTSLRGTLTRVGPYSESTGTIEVAGENMRIEVSGTYADGHVEGSTTVIIGDEITEVALDGSVETSRLGADVERLRPFAASSAAVVSAALTGSDITDLGTSEVGDVEADHYRIEPDGATRQALAALSPGELAWFELEYPERVTSIEVWVADDLIRRIAVVADWSDDPNEDQVETTTLDFYDFNADITITPLDTRSSGGSATGAPPIAAGEPGS